jgi:MFS family permease
VLHSFTIRRGSWKDMFVERRLDYIPEGSDRLGMLILVTLMNVMGTFAIQVGPIAALIIQSQGFTLASYGAIIAIVSLAVSLSNFAGAQLADRFPRTRLFLWGMIPAIICHFIMAIMPDNLPVVWVVLYVAFMFTEGWALVVLTPLARDFTPRSSRAGGLGIYQVGNNLSAVLALLLTGVLLQPLGNVWQRMFFAYGIIALALFILGVLFIREPSAGLKAQIIHSDEAARHAREVARVIEAQGIKIAGFWKFVKSGGAALYAVAFGQALLLIGYITFNSYGTVYAIQFLGMTPANAATLNSTYFAGVVVFLVLGGLAADWLRLKKACAFIGTIGAGLSLGALFLFKADSDPLVVALDYFIGGAMVGIMWGPAQALFSESAENVSTTRVATGFAILRFCTAVVYSAWTFLLPILVGAYQWPVVMVIAGALGVIGAFGFLFAPGRTWARESLRRPSIRQSADDVPQPAVAS